MGNEKLKSFCIVMMRDPGGAFVETPRREAVAETDGATAVWERHGLTASAIRCGSSKPV